MIGGRDRQEFEAFVAASSDRLLRTAYLLTGDAGHAEDVVQSALLRTARRWRSARRRRRRTRGPWSPTWPRTAGAALGRRPAEAPLEHDVPLAAHEGLLDRDALMRAARGLPPGQRAVLVLRYFDDLSVEETAAALGVTTGTVKSQTSRALAGLRAALTTETNDPDQGERRCSPMTT